MATAPESIEPSHPVAGGAAFPAWLGVALGAFALYAATAGRGVQWQDSSHFMFKIATGDLLGNLGLALTHPLHHWLGRAAVAIAGPQPYAITLVSSLCGALTVANVFGCVRSLTRRPAAALFAAGSLALAHTFWRLSTITEVYTVGAALLAAVCWSLSSYGRSGDRRALWLACLLNGLGVANDMQSGLTALVLITVGIQEARERRITLGDFAVATVLWLAGAAPYAALVVNQLVASGDLAGTVRSALFGTMWHNEVLGFGISRRAILVDVGYPLLNFPNLLLPAAVLGMVRARDLGVLPVVRWALFGILGVQSAFALRYDVVDQYTFFLPMYVMLSVFGGIGAWALLQSRPPRRWLAVSAVLLLVATPVTYAAATALARGSHLLAGFVRNKPYRDDYVYLLTPWAVADGSAEQMSSHVLELAGPHGRIVFEDWMGHYAVRYGALLRGWDDPKSTWWQEAGVDAFIRDAVASGHPVVLIPWDRDRPQSVPPIGRWRRDGDVYVLGP